jgi:hypothetical protein
MDDHRGENTIQVSGERSAGRWLVAVLLASLNVLMALFVGFGALLGVALAGTAEMETDWWEWLALLGIGVGFIVVTVQVLRGLARWAPVRAVDVSSPAAAVLWLLTPPIAVMTTRDVVSLVILAVGATFVLVLVRHS